MSNRSQAHKEIGLNVMSIFEDEKTPEQQEKIIPVIPGFLGSKKNERTGEMEREILSVAGFMHKTEMHIFRANFRNKFDTQEEYQEACFARMTKAFAAAMKAFELHQDLSTAQLESDATSEGFHGSNEVTVKNEVLVKANKNKSKRS